MINKIYKSKLFKLLKIIVIFYIFIYTARDIKNSLVFEINSMFPHRIETINVIFPEGDKEENYIVWASNGDKYINRDSSINGKHNSGIIQGYLLGKKHVTPRGQSFQCIAEVVGVRMSLPSMFPNILKINCDQS